MSVAEARRRHPSTQPPVPVARVASRMVDLLDRRGVTWPQVAVAAMQVRGRTCESPDELARRLGVPPDVVRRAEVGELALDELPRPLRSQVAEVLLGAEPRWSA